MHDANLLFLILILTIGMFIWGRFRYDVVALMCLLALTLTGLIPSEKAFSGFSNSAVISVAMVMVISAALIQSGLVDQVISFIQPLLTSPMLLIGAICIIASCLSAFVNDVGALSILMPVAIQGAIAAKLSPSKILMPLSFATLLGGMTTKIGTPPNLLISSYRESIVGAPFSMFDYTPTGLSVAFGGLVFIIFIGWRLVPARRKPSNDPTELYQLHDYISEVRIPEGSTVVGMSRQELESLIEGDLSIIGLIRGRKKKIAIPGDEELLPNDVLIIEASHDDLNKLITAGKLELFSGEVFTTASLVGQNYNTVEAVVTPGSRVHGRSWQQLRIRSRMGLNLIAIARSGKPLKNRLHHVNFNPGDVLLLQGVIEELPENLANLGLVPLAERNISVGFRRTLILPLLFFIGGILLNVFQIVPIQVAFTLVVVAMIGVNIISVHQVYKSIDWSIIVMLGALIPLGLALKTTGAARMIGQSLLFFTEGTSVLVILGLLIMITMTLSDVMNNAATAVVMAPIGADIAELLHMSPDPFLIAISIGASCSCLTPISHQNNTLIMGPGGYKFFDYLWLGIPLEVIVLLTALPSLYYFWL
ncbi:SLC13 family permease [Legionella antarctica]|uniref:SLC13 family permease n=1 Tax=Legionella antarctica TaxID=2708020 RepID=A0A6F8T8Z8_9GAMM|nr:SLC13 family permease [Legionella antarctica]BCA96456.1 SLC13 family permease [Legionella antarctica]